MNNKKSGIPIKISLRGIRGIRGKLTWLIISLSLSIIIIISLASFISGSDALKHEAVEKLSAVAELKTQDGSLNKAKKSGLIVKNSIQAINEINSSSQKIVEIISVINEIAFQTNLPALNASVEAARAVEQGSGFAVVASEVRNLARRTGEASKEIESLIRDSIDRVIMGTDMSRKSGEALNDIIGRIENLNKTISEIAAAGEEQRTGIDQINTAIPEMDSMTQQNASLVEETASTGEGMSNQAQELLTMVERFKINRDPSL